MPTAPPGEAFVPVGSPDRTGKGCKVADGGMELGWENQHQLLHGRSYGVERGLGEKLDSVVGQGGYSGTPAP